MRDVCSHIQMPKCVLKNFQNEKQTIFYYDFLSSEIKRGRAKTINTEFGYYSEATERYLRDNIETPFGRIMNLIKEITINPQFRVDPNTQSITFRFLHALLCRGPEMMVSINKNSIFYQFLSPQEQHDYAVIFGLALADKVRFYDDYFITFSINDSYVPFVLPMQGLYSYTFSQSKYTCLNFPITPKHAITLVHKRHAASFIENRMIKMISVTDPRIAHMLNVRAFMAEKRFNKSYVISNQQKELELLVNQWIYEEVIK